MLHHHLGGLAHGEGKGGLDVLRVAQLVNVLPEDLRQVRRHLLVERDLHQLGGGGRGGATVTLQGLSQKTLDGDLRSESDDVRW